MAIRQRRQVDPNVLFVHVPKTAGQHTKTALRRVAEIRTADKNGEQIHHMPYKELLKVDPRWASLPSLATVRHPYDRFVSAYFFLRGHRGTDPKTKVTNPSWHLGGLRHQIEVIRHRLPEFEDFFDAFANCDFSDLEGEYHGDKPNYWYKEWGHNQFMNSVFFRPQWQFTDGVETVCRIETLQADIDQFCYDNGLERVIIKPAKQSGHRPETDEVLGATEKGILQRFYAADFKRFGFEP